MESSFVLRNALSKTLALILASNNPKSLLDGASINIHSVLAIVNKNEFHHIFPKDYLTKRNYDNIQINQHANICMLNLGNNRTISNKAPSEYFLTVKSRLGSSLHEILLSNFIDDIAYRCALEDDFEGFIAARKRLILIRAMELCENYEEVPIVADEFPVDFKKNKKEALEYEQMNLEF